MSGIAFYGWAEGSNVRVVLPVEVPVEGAANRFYSSGDTSTLKLEEFATCTLKVGESRKLDDMKSAGMDVVSIRVETRTQ